MTQTPRHPHKRESTPQVQKQVVKAAVSLMERCGSTVELEQLSDGVYNLRVTLANVVDPDPHGRRFLAATHASAT